jgi:ABC-2 type transport system ATP-binding protein
MALVASNEQLRAGPAPQPHGPVPAVQLAGIEKSYGLVRRKAALCGVSLTIARGECYGLIGPNGAGKTTLILVMLGLIAPDAGEVRLLGVRPELPDVRRRVGFVPEAAELPPHASPLQLMRRWARLRGLPVRAAVEQGEATLGRLGMGELVTRPAHRFSKGEKQRTLLALALLGAPELLVLDEPTDGLDPLGRALVRKVILEECAAGRTVFLNSHLLSETERVCTRVGILHGGQLAREEVLGGDGPAPEERATTALVLAAPLSAQLEAAIGARKPAGDPGSPHLYLVDHDELDGLNRAIDRLRAAGVQLVEVRRVRRDLEETFRVVATADPRVAGPSGDARELIDGPRAPVSPLRPVRATIRVAREIASDLVARKMAHAAAAGAALFLAMMFFALHNQILQGMAATARQFRAGGMVDNAQLAHVLGRGAAAGEFWTLLVGSVFLSAFFAPPLLDARRSTLLFAQPVSRADVANGIFISVCGLALGIFGASGVALFVGLRAFTLPVSPGLLAVPMLTTVALASLYAIVLLVTYLLPNGLLAGVVGMAALLALVVAGNSDAAQPGNAEGVSAFFVGLLPKLVGLHRDAMRVGGGAPPALFAILSTIASTLALMLFVQIVARRSER